MSQINFSEWLRTDEALATKSGLSTTDFTHLSLQDRMAQGREIGEPFIKNQLAMHGIKISNVTGRMDRTQKIDGMWNGSPIQIKLRRSGMSGRNDISFEVCRNHDKSLKLIDQLKNPDQQGRDYKGQVQHYFVMNQSETEIYHILANALKASVNKAIHELNKSRMDGYLTAAFVASDGTELRPTQDKDPNSFTPFKVMAFIPVNNVIEKAYPIQHGTTANPLGHTPPTTGIGAKTETELAADEAERNGSATITIKSTNPKNIEKKIKEIRSFALARRLNFTDNRNGTVTLSK